MNGARPWVVACVLLGLVLRLAFALLSWLFVAAFILVVTAALGATLVERPQVAQAL